MKEMVKIWRQKKKTYCSTDRTHDRKYGFIKACYNEAIRYKSKDKAKKIIWWGKTEDVKDVTLYCWTTKRERLNQREKYTITSKEDWYAGEKDGRREKTDIIRKETQRKNEWGKKTITLRTYSGLFSFFGNDGDGSVIVCLLCAGWCSCLIKKQTERGSGKSITMRVQRGEDKQR